MPTRRSLPYLTRSFSSASLQRRQNPSTTQYSKPSSPASLQNSFIPARVLSPPSRYFQTPRPGLSQSVATPLGNSLASGGGLRFGTASELTSAFRSAPTSTTRQGVVMAPVTAAGLDTRSMSASL